MPFLDMYNQHPPDVFQVPEAVDPGPWHASAWRQHPGCEQSSSYGMISGALPLVKAVTSDGVMREWSTPKSQRLMHGRTRWIGLEAMARENASRHGVHVDLLWHITAAHHPSCPSVEQRKV